MHKKCLEFYTKASYIENSSLNNYDTNKHTNLYKYFKIVLNLNLYTCVENSL